MAIEVQWVALRAVESFRVRSGKTDPSNPCG